MNLSGEVLRSVSDFHRVSAAEVLVVLDDMALPLGRLRLRAGGSAGGHNGLKSIIQHLGTLEVPRLRIGIGSAAAGAAVGHVLGRFSDEEAAPLESALGRAVDAIACVQERGLETAMNLYN
jgi:PTH1 family peptidyl-tRNA hydrolase